MCVTANFVAKALCIILICVPYCYSHSYRGQMARISIKGDFITLSEDQVLFKVGEAAEIICTGRNADNLVLYKADEFRGLQQLPVEIVNTTAIRFKVNKTETPMKLTFKCSDSSIGNLHSKTLLFDGPPDLRNFQCVSKNLVSLSCTWNTINIEAGFNLYVLNDQPSKICNIPVHEVDSDIYDLSCIWDRTRIPRYTPEAVTLRLLMEYCNYTHCVNKTYDYNHLSIVKLDPPKVELQGVISNANYRYVDVECLIPMKTFKLLEGVNQKLELWSFPNRREKIYSSSIIANGNSFRIDVHLPCYGQKYELKVSVLTYQADEENWSDYASVTFETDNFVPEDGEVCEERKVDETADIMLYELYKLRMKVKEEQSQLKREIGELKARVGQKDI